MDFLPLNNSSANQYSLAAQTLTIIVSQPRLFPRESLGCETIISIHVIRLYLLQVNNFNLLQWLIQES